MAEEPESFCAIGRPTSKMQNAASAEKPARRDTGMAMWLSVSGCASRQSHRPSTPPKTIAPTCATDDVLNKMMRALKVGSEAARHAPHRLRDNGDGDELEAMQQSVSDRPGQRAGAVGEEHHQDRRRQGEAGPSSQRPAIAGADQPDGESGLAGRWARQELAQRDQIDEGLLAQPTAANDKLLAEIADMRDRTAERTDAELEEGPEHFERRARALVACNALVQSHAESSRLSANLPALPSGLEIFL